MIDLEEGKFCTICGEYKLMADFFSRKARNKKVGEYIYYHPECRKCTAAKATIWRKSNKEKYKKIKNNYYLKKDKPKLIEHAKRRRENGEYKKWQEKNPDKIKIYNQQHQNHKISKKQWIKCRMYFNYKCCYCGIDESIHKLNFKQQLHRDHAQHDGTNDLSNCLPACRRCNTSKHTSTIEVWYNETKQFFTVERLEKIKKWLNEDYKEFK